MAVQELIEMALELSKIKNKPKYFVCRDCGYRFSQNYKKCTGQHNYANYALIEEAKKLEPVTETKTVTSDEKDVKGKILQHHVQMKLDGYKDSTIRLSKSALNTLINRGADLTNPQTVKKVISEQSWSGNRKRNVINAYTKFLDFTGLTWQPPNYEITRKIPFIPTEQEIDDLIAASPNPLAAFLQLLKETAMRRGEAIAIPWKDVDLERRIIMCNYPEKGSNPRIFSDLSGKLLNMLNNLPKENEMLFGTTTECMLKNQLCRTRKRLAFKLGNPRLNEIHCPHPKTLESNNAIPLQTRHTDSCRVPRTQRPRKHTPVHFSLKKAYSRTCQTTNS